MRDPNFIFATQIIFVHAAVFNACLREYVCKLHCIVRVAHAIEWTAYKKHACKNLGLYELKPNGIVRGRGIVIKPEYNQQVDRKKWYNVH